MRDEEATWMYQKCYDYHNAFDENKVKRWVESFDLPHGMLRIMIQLSLYQS